METHKLKILDHTKEQEGKRHPSPKCTDNQNQATYHVIVTPDMGIVMQSVDVNR